MAASFSNHLVKFHVSKICEEFRNVTFRNRLIFGMCRRKGQDVYCRSITGLGAVHQKNQISKQRPFSGSTQELVDPAKQYEEQLERNAEVEGTMTELVRDFLDPSAFYMSLRNIGVEFFAGVPDSLLKDFCAYLSEHAPRANHVITCNEGAAMALSAGYHLATGRFGLVYLQNSGLGNLVNPLMSLASPEVYSVPALLLIGWRGEPGKRDEPQHLAQGNATPALLTSLHVPFQVLPDYQEGADKALQMAKHYLETSKGPYALLVKRQTFVPYKKAGKQQNIILPEDSATGEASTPRPLKRNNNRRRPPDMTREAAVAALVGGLRDRDIVVATTGMLSRELFEHRARASQGHHRDFLTVGSMGHAGSIALGLAMQKPDRRVFCLDGDGSMLMHLGSVATTGQVAPRNLYHVVFNNGVHDSVGGQPTAAGDLSRLCLPGVALACGYRAASRVADLAGVAEALADLGEGPEMLEVLVKRGARKNLGRPTRTPMQNKNNFTNFVFSG